MRLGLVLVLLAVCRGFSETPAPTFVEFSTQFLAKIGNSASTTVATGPAGDFYVAGTAGATPTTLAEFPKQPVNRIDGGLNFSQISFLAHFSGSGELIEWRTLGTASLFSVSALLTNVPGRVALVLTGPQLAEPATEGAWFKNGASGRSLLVLSSDLRDVLVSTYLTPINSNVNDAVLDRDGSIVYTGVSYVGFANEGRVTATGQTNVPFVARVSADGKELQRVRPLAGVGGAASRLALAADGGVWLGVASGNANLAQTGPLTRPYGGTNTMSWDPASQEWTTALRPEVATGNTFSVYGYPSRPGQFIASDGFSLFRSDDNGVSWQAVGRYPGGTLVTSVSDPNRLYAWQSVGVSVSDDQGASWTAVVLPEGSFGSVRQLAVAADNPDVLALRISGPNLSYFSVDRGRTWKPAGDPLGTLPSGMTLAAEGGPAPRMLLLDALTGVYESDGAPAWRKLGQGAGNGGTELRYLPGTAPVLVQNNGPLFSTDYGASWRELPACSFNTVCSLWVNPGASNEWWLTGAGVSRSVDGGATWTVIRESIGPARVTSLAFSGTGEQPVLAFTQLTADVHLRRLDAAWEQLQSAFYLGGGGNEALVAMRVDSAGRLNVVSTTDSPDYPVTPDALQAKADGAAMALTRLSTASDAVEYSTVWGGAALAQTTSVRAHIAGDRVIWCGTTVQVQQPNLAEPKPDGLPTGSRGAFLGGFDGATGQWLPTFVLGGEGTTNGHDCAEIRDQRFVLAGHTTSAVFPWVGQSYALPAFQGIIPPPQSALFLSILRAQ